MRIQRILRFLDFRNLFSQMNQSPSLRRGWGQSPLITDRFYGTNNSTRQADEIIVIPTSPNALENFKTLVKEENTAKLIEYFSQFGIDSKIIQNNLHSLVQKELKDLSRQKANIPGLG